MSYNETLIKLDAPLFHLVLDTRADFFWSAQRWYLYDKCRVGSRIIRGWKSHTAKSFFDEFAAAFQLPSYFGENWNAFDECINDLDWMPASAYIVFISDVDQVLPGEPIDFNILIRQLKHAAEEWTQGRTFNPSFPTPPTPFHIVFHCALEKEQEVRKRLADAGLENIDTLHLVTDI